MLTWDSIRAKPLTLTAGTHSRSVTQVLVLLREVELKGRKGRKLVRDG